MGKKGLIRQRIQISVILFCALCCSLTIVYSTSTLPLLERSIINCILLHQSCKRQIWIFAYMYTLRAIFKLIRNHVCAYIGNTVVNDLREQAIKKLITERGRQDSAYEYTVLTNDLPVIADLLSFQTFVFAENLLILILAIYNMLKVSVSIGMIFIFGLLILLWNSWSFISQLHPVVSQIKDKTLEMTAHIKECVVLNKAIWAFDQQKSLEDSLGRDVEGIAACQREQVDIEASGRGYIDFLSRAIFVTSIAAGTFNIIHSGTDIGILVMVNTYSKTLTNVTLRMGDFIRFVVNSQESIRRYRLLTGKKKKLKISNWSASSEDQQFTLHKRPEEICFAVENLSKNGTVILQNVCIHAKKSEFVVIFGNSGAGKTALADSLAGIGEAESADLYFDGKLTRNMQQYWSITGYCPQIPLFFSTSIENNITLWKSHTDLKMLEMFCDLHFVNDLPEGYHTRISSDNPFMSGGEKQRVSLARTIALNPYVLILDDCFDAIDSVRKKEILLRLKEYGKNRIIILLTSDKSLNSFADRIYCIKGETVGETF